MTRCRVLRMERLLAVPPCLPEPDPVRPLMAFRETGLKKTDRKSPILALESAGRGTSGSP